MHPIRVICLIFSAVFLYVAGHVYIRGQEVSQRYAPRFITAEINWSTTINGQRYALTQYPKGATDPGPWAMNDIARSGQSSFFDEITSESGQPNERNPRGGGASRRVTSLILAGSDFELPLRVEVILLGLGLLALALPRLILGAQLVHQAPSPSTGQRIAP